MKETVKIAFECQIKWVILREKVMGDADGRWWWTSLEFDAMAYLLSGRGESLQLRYSRLIWPSNCRASSLRKGLTSDSTW